MNILAAKTGLDEFKKRKKEKQKSTQRWVDLGTVEGRCEHDQKILYKTLKVLKIFFCCLKTV